MGPYMLYRKGQKKKKKSLFSTPNNIWECNTENTPKESKTLPVVRVFLKSTQGTRQHIF